jgi:hypothetical protein
MAGSMPDRFNFDHIPLMNLTHLLILLLPIVPWAQWKSIALLPKLSHLAVDVWHPEFIGKVLEECKSLNLLVIISPETMPSYRTSNSRLYGIFKADPRFNELISIPPEWITSWERGALTGNDIWSRVEAARGSQETRGEKTT